MRKSLKIIFAALLIYVLLLLALVSSEGRNPQGSIQSIWDALWFSIETVTTVGYGDLSPVSPMGKLISAFFAMCSIGLISALVGIVVSLMSGSLIPRMRLHFLRGREWFYFSEENEYSIPLAKELSRRGVIIFHSSEGSGSHCGHVFRIPANLESILNLKNKKTSKSEDGNPLLKLFFVSEDYGKNYSEALRFCDLAETFCLCEREFGVPKEKITLFSVEDCMARSYWKRYPLESEERTVILVGDGLSTEALLERALLINIFQKERETTYHVFGGAADFCLDHPVLLRALDSVESGDKVQFHSGSWKEDMPLLQAVDRVIFCWEEDSKNLKAFCEFTEFFPTSAKMHLRLKREIRGILSFGSIAEAMTEENVLRGELNRLAKTMNAVYNKTASEKKEWEKLTPFLRASNIAAADHVPIKVRYLLNTDRLHNIEETEYSKAYREYRRTYEDKKEEMEEMEHRRWLRFHLMYNWEYAPIRDNEKRRHPLMVPFEELSEKEKRKDDFAWEILNQLADKTSTTKYHNEK